MPGDKFQIGLPAALALVLLCYLLDGRELLALALPVLAHELGHILALRLLGLRIRRIRLDLSGLSIEHLGLAGPFAMAAAALAGPLAGILYALGASYLSALRPLPWLELTGGISLLLSLFNLLPAQPLDGGRILASLFSLLPDSRLGEELLYISGLTVGALLMAAGYLCMFKGWGLGPMLAGTWILFYQGRGLVKRREML